VSRLRWSSSSKIVPWLVIWTSWHARSIASMPMTSAASDERPAATSANAAAPRPSAATVTVGP
jgi:hypothetical protein